MHEYHCQLPQESNAEFQSQPFEDSGAIAVWLHIKDMSGWKNTQDMAHTVEDEYHSYTQGMLTSQGEDPLRFWDVHVLFATDSWIMDANKST